MKLGKRVVDRLIQAAQCTDVITGLTHGFYSYPARFSPLFVRAVIESFTHRGDVILDPFMGGGTTLVEAAALGRRAVGADINSLAVFVSRVKTTYLDEDDFAVIEIWAKELPEKLNLHRSPIREDYWIREGYQRNINNKTTWRIRKVIELALSEIINLPKEKQRNMARCAILRTAQWALDCRKKIPTVMQFRKQLLQNIQDMATGAREYCKCLNSNGINFEAICINKSASYLEETDFFDKIPAPSLILTSPPYPGVHVLYHRWQIHGRRETPAPFWIANCLDGHGASHYTFGGREQQEFSQYFKKVEEAFKAIARIAKPGTILVQMVGFPEPSSQLDKYLYTLGKVGFEEFKLPNLFNSVDGRLWRTVPNRKWYANKRGPINTSIELVLFHVLREKQSVN